MGVEFVKTMIPKQGLARLRTTQHIEFRELVDCDEFAPAPDAVTFPLFLVGLDAPQRA